jgi:hypothetical protein
MDRIFGRYGRDAIVAIYRGGCGLTAGWSNLAAGEIAALSFGRWSQTRRQPPPMLFAHER